MWDLVGLWWDLETKVGLGGTLVGLGGTWWDLVGLGDFGGTWWDLVGPGGTWWDLVTMVGLGGTLVGLNDLGGTCVQKLTYLWMGLPSRPIKGGDL